MPPSCSAIGAARTKKLVFQSHDKGKGRRTSNDLVFRGEDGSRWRKCTTRAAGQRALKPVISSFAIVYTHCPALPYFDMIDEKFMMRFG